MTVVDEVAGDAVAVAAAVAAAVDDRLDDLLSDTAELVGMDSPTFDVPRLDATAAAIASIGTRLGLDVAVLPGADNGVYVQASIDGNGDDEVVLLCHHDTVFPVGTCGQWGFSVDDDHMYGPGVVDMKGGITLGLHTMAALQRVKDAYGRVRLLSVPDEEERDGPPLYLPTDAAALVLTLECGRENRDIVSARKAGAWLRLHFRGRAAHAGVDPDAGHNAAVKAAAEALRIAALHRGRPGLSVTVTGLTGGVGINTVPPEATVTVDVRASLEKDMDDVVGEIFDVVADPVTLRCETLSRTPAMERTPAVAALARFGAGVGGDLNHEFGEQTAGGSSDACWAAAVGCAVLDGLGPVGGRDHTPDEYGLVSSFAPRAGVLAALIMHGPNIVRAEQFSQCALS